MFERHSEIYLKNGKLFRFEGKIYTSDNKFKYIAKPLEDLHRISIDDGEHYPEISGKELNRIFQQTPPKTKEYMESANSLLFRGIPNKLKSKEEPIPMIVGLPVETEPEPKKEEKMKEQIKATALRVSRELEPYKRPLFIAALLFSIDYFIFKGKYTKTLHAMVNKVFNKLSDKLESFIDRV